MIECPNRRIAAHAQQAADFTGLVIVINRQSHLCVSVASSTIGLRSLADCTLPALRFEKGSILLRCQAISSAQVSEMAGHGITRPAVATLLGEPTRTTPTAQSSQRGDFELIRWLDESAE